MKPLFIVALLVPLAASQIPGGIFPFTAKLTDAPVAFAEAQINQYFLAKDRNAAPRNVVKILSATRQVVAGFMFRYKVEVSGGSEKETCDVAVLQQLWLKNPSDQLHIQSLTCKPEAEEEAPAPKDQLLGGEFPIDAKLTDASVIFAGAQINQHFQEQDSNAAPRTLVKILSATQQVVAGFLFRYKLEVSGGPTHEICDVAVLDQSWLKNPADKLHIQSLTCKPEEENEAPAPKAQLFGGEEPANWNNVVVQKALASLVDDINMQSNNMYRVVPSEGQVTKQVVNGWILRFKNLKMLQTSCRNSMEATGKVSLTDCPANENSESPQQNCQGEVHWQPRAEVKFTVKVAKCEAVTLSPKSQPEYQTLTANFNDDDVQRALKALTDQVNMGCNCLYRKIPVSGNVIKEVEGGLLYRFSNLQFVETTCTNNNSNDVGKITLEECPQQANSAKFPVCSGEVSFSPLAPSGSRLTVKSTNGC